MPRPRGGETSPRGSDASSVRADGDAQGAQPSAIVGATGAGKTTLAKLLTRLVDPDRGEVRLAGVPWQESARSACAGGWSWCRRMASSSAAPSRQSPIWMHARCGRGLRPARLDDWIAGLADGMQTHVGERGQGLSAGERQLVAIARAHAAGADLLLLDEATSAVDPATETRLAVAMEAASRGRTTITIAHRMTTAAHADEVIVVDDGEIVQRGPHRRLVEEHGSVYASLHAAFSEDLAYRVG